MPKYNQDEYYFSNEVFVHLRRLVEEIIDDCKNNEPDTQKDSPQGYYNQYGVFITKEGFTNARNQK